MSSRGGCFGAIAKLNYDATLELELPRLLHVARFGGALMPGKSLQTPAFTVDPPRRGVHIKPMKSEAPIFVFAYATGGERVLPFTTLFAVLPYE
jgi:hypothetical protein